MTGPRQTLLLALGCLLAACGSNPKGPLLSSINDQALPSVAKNVNADLELASVRAIEQYQQYVALELQSALDAEAQRRLADIQLELAERAEAIAVDELEAQQNGEDGSSAEVEIPEIEYAQLAATYEQVLADYPDFEHNDEVLYQLAKIYIATAETQKAMAALERLSRDYPDSPLYVEAQFRRGENLFIEGDYQQAADAYQQVMAAGKESPFFDYALYKYGWAQFTLTHYEEARDAFFRLLDERMARHDMATIDSLGDLPLDEQETTADAFRSISLSLYYQAGATTLADYFSRKGERDYAHLVYANLASFYLDVGRRHDAIATYRAYITRQPLAKLAPAFQLKVIDTWTALADKTETLQAKRFFVEEYGLQAPYWSSQNRPPPALISEQLRLNLAELAQHYHAIARRSGQVADYAEARLFYRAYIDSFPNDPQTPNMNFLLAETLYDNGDFEQAIAEYEHTAYDYPAHERASEAGYAAILAYDKQEATLPPELRPDWRHFAVNSALKFNAAFPNHPQALAVLTRAAQELFELDDKTQAVKVAMAVLQREDAPDKLRLTAATIVAHSKIDEGDYLAAESNYQLALKLSPPQDPKRHDLTEGLAAAIYKQGEQFLEVGDQESAARQFMRIPQVTPTASIVATARYDAAAALIAAKNWSAAIVPLEQFRKFHSNHPLHKEVRRKLALAYMENNQYGDAAREFELISWREPEGDTPREALWQAALLYQKAGDTKSYAKTLENYLRRFPAPFDQAMEARQQLAQIEKERGNTGRYHHWLNAIISSHEKAGKAATERSLYLAATASLVLADTALARFSHVKLVEPIQRNLKLKRKYLKSSLAAYEKCAAYGVADVTTAATYRIAELYNEFSTALWDSERPKNLDDLALEQYELMLEEQAIPFEDKAIELHEVNVARTQEEGIYTAWSAKSFSKLAEIYPARYNKKEQRVEMVTSLR